MQPPHQVAPSASDTIGTMLLTAATTAGPSFDPADTAKFSQPTAFHKANHVDDFPPTETRG